MGRKVGDCCVPLWRELGPHLTECDLASSDIAICHTQMNARALLQSVDKPAESIYICSTLTTQQRFIQRQSLRNHKTHHHSPAVKSLNDLRIEPPWSASGGQDASAFLVYDNGVDAEAVRADAADGLRRHHVSWDMHRIVCHQRSSQRLLASYQRTVQQAFILVMTVVLVRVGLWNSFSVRLVITHICLHCDWVSV